MLAEPTQASTVDATEAPDVSSSPGASRAAACAALALLLAACGGGGGGASPAPAPSITVPQPVIAGCTQLYPVSASATPGGTVDPLLASQWHLKAANDLTGEQGLGASTAWALARGRGVRVAIIDGPVETLHEDLAANVVAGASWDYRTAAASAPLPCTDQDVHGTAVAGIIAAVQGNGLGGAGVAPAASLVAYDAIIRGASEQQTNERIADALSRDLTRNHIFHNSWGSADDGALHAAQTAAANAIRSGVRSGRNGLGALYVFASGNGGCLTVDGSLTYDGTRCTSRDMTGFDGFLNLPGTVTACAVDHQGRLPLWGEEGENLLVCGLSSGSGSAIATLAIGNGSRSDFGGASAAAPMVSGVIALMLEANPLLSWRDIRLILAETARENQPNDASWVNTALPKWPPPGNGAPITPKRFSRKFGYGVVDADAAVRRAQTWTQSVGGSSTLIECSKSSTGTPIALSDPSAANPVIQFAQDTIRLNAQDCGLTQIEWVEVVLSASHTYSGDLQIELQSPAGRTSRLADPRYCAGTSNRSRTSDGQDRCASYSDWTFLSNRHIGENAQGDWTLRIADAVPGETGSLDRWTIRVSGR